MRVTLRAMLFMGLVVGATPSQAALFTEEWVNVETPLKEDVYAAGRDVRIGARIAGDVTAAGMTVRIDDIVEDDVIAAAEHVSVHAPVVDDLRAAGRRVDIAADVGDHVVAAGDTVHVADGVNIGGFAWLAGREVRVDGNVGGELRIAAERVILGGEMAGDVEVTAEHIELRPGARIQGNFLWHSRKPPAVADDATVGGRVIERPLPEHRPDRAAWVFGALFMALVLLVTGAVLLLMFPRCFTGAANAARAQPGKVVLIGLAVFAATPVVAVLLLLTGIGWLLAVLVLLAWLVSLPIAWFVAAYILGTLALPRAREPGGVRHWPRWVAMLGGIVVLALLQFLPVLGALLAVFALWVGLGALGINCYGRSTTAPAS